MSLIQHNDHSWVFCFAWMNRDMTCVDESAPDEIRFGLHPDGRALSSDGIRGLGIEWDRSVGPIMQSCAVEWWTLTHQSEALRYLMERPDVDSLTPQQLVDFLRQVGYQDVTEYRDDSLLEGIVETVSSLSELKLDQLQRLLKKRGFALKAQK